MAAKDSRQRLQVIIKGHFTPRPTPTDASHRVFRYHVAIQHPGRDKQVMFDRELHVRTQPPPPDALAEPAASSPAPVSVQKEESEAATLINPPPPGPAETTDSPADDSATEAYPEALGHEATSEANASIETGVSSSPNDMTPGEKRSPQSAHDALPVPERAADNASPSSAGPELVLPAPVSPQAAPPVSEATSPTEPAMTPPEPAPPPIPAESIPDLPKVPPASPSSSPDPAPDKLPPPATPRRFMARIRSKVSGLHRRILLAKLRLSPGRRIFARSRGRHRGRPWFVTGLVGLGLGLVYFAVQEPVPQPSPPPAADRPEVTHAPAEPQTDEAYHAVIEKHADGVVISLQGPDHETVLTKLPPGYHPTVENNKIVHIVTPGNTLWFIAKRYIKDPYRYPELARLNRIKNPDLIYPGDRVVIQFLDKP